MQIVAMTSTVFYECTLFPKNQKLLEPIKETIYFIIYKKDF